MNNPAIAIFNGLIEALALIPILIVWILALVFISLHFKSTITDIITHHHASKIFAKNPHFQKQVEKQMGKTK